MAEGGTNCRCPTSNERARLVFTEVITILTERMLRNGEIPPETVLETIWESPNILTMDLTGYLPDLRLFCADYRKYGSKSVITTFVVIIVN